MATAFAFAMKNTKLSETNVIPSAPILRPSFLVGSMPHVSATFAPVTLGTLRPLAPIANRSVTLMMIVDYSLFVEIHFAAALTQHAAY
jgi:hypothetical protein